LRYKKSKLRNYLTISDITMSDFRKYQI